MTRASDGSRSILVSLALCAALALVAAACGGGSNTTPGGSGGSGGGGNSGGALYQPCASDTRVGGFILESFPPMDTDGKWQLSGAIRDKVNPPDVWVAEMTEGPCKLVTPPRCMTNCSLPQVCSGATCVPAPGPRNAGTVTVSGLSMPVTAMPIGDRSVYSVVHATYPVYADGAEITLKAAGADTPAFMLRGSGVARVQSSTTPVQVRSGQPFTLTWTPAPAAGAGKMSIKVDIAHHGGVAANILCEAPDTGSITISAAMVDALIAKGTAGFPAAHLERRTVDSTMLQGLGCVDFAVATRFNGDIGVPLVVNGVQSCASDEDCPAGKTCPPAGSPNGLSCV